jgi:hypothetical protein
MTPIEMVIVGVCLMLIALPPRYDPAIRIKERQIKRGEHPEA